MNNKPKMSVNGLQNIGALIGRADMPTPAPKRDRRNLDGIFQRTREKVQAAVPLGANLDPKHWALIDNYLKAGLDEAKNLGHAEALDQNSQVEKLLEQQYEARTKVTMPAVAAAIMEQQGLASMTMDLALMATVFERTKITYTLDAETNVIEYNLRPVGEHEE